MRHTTPTPDAPAAPAVHVHTLGTFRVEVGGQPLRFGAKGPRKPLALLKALIAMGGRWVPTEPLVESLWPDAEGDRAQRSFRVALHRLRGLLGAESVLLSAGRLTLNPERCWLDAQACEMHLETARAAATQGDVEAAWKEAQHALGLYRGPFLAGEFDPPEVPAARGRLHVVLLRQVVALAEFLLAAGEGERAVHLCRQGLERDETAAMHAQGSARGDPEPAWPAEPQAAAERLRQVLAAGTSRTAPAAAAPFPPMPDVSAAVAELQRSARFPLPAQPSLVVLAFAGLGGAAGEGALAQGISEGLIAELSRIQNLFVIAPESAFVYRGEAGEPRRVGRELGVRYVLTGTVQRDGERMRITVQLVDSATGRHVWAERFDRAAQDPFAVQDEICWRVVTELEVQLTEGEQARSRRNATRSLTAYEAFSRSLDLFRRLLREDNRVARALAEQALEIDPAFTHALVPLAWTHWADARYGWSESREESLCNAEALARDLLARDAQLAAPHAILAQLHLLRRDFDAALTEGRASLELHRGNSSVQALMGLVLLNVGRYEQAVVCLRVAMRLSPCYPIWYVSTLGEACRLLGRHEEALDAFRTVIAHQPRDTILGRARLATLLVSLGRTDEARAIAAEMLELDPGFTVERYCASRLCRDPAVTEDIRNALLAAGLPA